MTTLSRGTIRKRTWKSQGAKKTGFEFTVVVERDGASKRIRRIFPTRAEAAVALDAFKDETLHPVAPAVPAPSSITLAAALERYLEVKARKKSLAEDQRIAKHLRNELGGQTPIAEITAGRISLYKASRLAVERSRRGGALSSASINRPLQLLRHLLRLAHEEWEALPAVPKIRLEKEPQGRIRWLEPDEEVRLLAACAASPNKCLLAIVTVALETGLRKGELLGLTWDRVDLSRGVIRLELTKSGKRREVPMRQAVYDILAGLPGPREGHVWATGGIRSAFEAAVREAKLDNFTLHCCRHHFVSWFIMRGGNIVALQEILGHASLTMTRRYAHLAPDHLRAEMAKTEAGQDAEKTQAVVESLTT